MVAKIKKRKSPEKHQRSKQRGELRREFTKRTGRRWTKTGTWEDQVVFNKMPD